MSKDPSPHDPTTHQHPLVKLIAALLVREEDALRHAIALLEAAFSPVEHLGAAHPFDSTDYYRAEMGGELRRWVVSFAALVPPTDLAGARHAAATVEDALRDPAGNRKVKTAPCPGALSTVISPPIMRLRRRLMARPSPVPP